MAYFWCILSVIYIYKSLLAFEIYNINIEQVLPEVIWEELRRLPHVRECALTLHALAVQCATL